MTRDLNKLPVRMTTAEFRQLGLVPAGKGLRFKRPDPAAQMALASAKGRGAAKTGPLPEDLLAEAVLRIAPEAEREFVGAVPGRRYRIDIALPAERIAIECDGWSNHGRFRKSHESDRERQNLLSVRGWLILRFTARQIFQDLPAVVATIEAARAQRRALAEHHG